MTMRPNADLLEAMQETVRLSLSPRQSDFVEEPIRQRLREARHERLARLADEAMRDPGFVADMHETMQAFRDAEC